VVVTGIMGVGLSAAPIYSLGAFMVPLSTEFGWTRTQLSFGATALSLTMGLGAPVIGRIVDRWGARRVGLIGTMLACLAVACLSLIDRSIVSFWVLYELVAIGGLACSPVVWTIAVATRFEKSRGLALSIALCGTNVAGAVSVLLVTTLIRQLDWRHAYIGLGLYMFLSAFPLALAFLYDASDLDKRAAVKSSTAARMTQPAAAKQGLTFGEALRTSIFWLIALSFLLASGAIVSVITHFVPLLTDRGLTPMIAASAASTMFIAALVGRIGSGFLLDRVFAPRIAAATFAPPVIACIGLLLFRTNEAGAFLAALLFGCALGAEFNLVSYLTARYFGFASYGLIYGTLFGCFAAGAGILPPVVGAMYQAYGDYRVALMVVAGSFFLSAALVQFLGPYPDFGGGEQAKPSVSPLSRAPKRILGANGAPAERITHG